MFFGVGGVQRTTLLLRPQRSRPSNPWRAPRIVDRDVVADLLQVNFGLWCEVRAHSLRTFFGHFGVLAFQTVKYLGGGFRFAAAATPFDFATQTVDFLLFSAPE